MIRNYIKTAFRNLKKNKGFTAINILGLALGLCICLLIVFYVVDEMSYDKFNTNADRIYRLNMDIKFGGNENSYAVTPAPTGAAIKAEFPEVEEVARMRGRGGAMVKKETQNIQEYNMIWADASLFRIFSLNMLQGDPKTALKDSHTAVITDEMAKKYFNTTNAVGKTLTFNDTTQYKVTGVIKKMPKQSHFHFDFFLSMVDLNESKENTWFSNNFVTYLLLRSGADADKLNAKLPSFLRKQAGPQLLDILHINFDQLEKGGSYLRLNLTALKDIHLKSNRVNELDMNGSIQYVYIFSAIAIFILLIACVNFMNLSTARSANRAREVGVRKVLGSAKKQLIFQFLTESVMVTLVSAIIAVFAAWALLPVFNSMSGKELAITPQIASWLAPVLVGLVLVIGFLAGAYPAFFLSAFQPIDVLKGKIAAGFKGGFLRSFLVVFQFSISVFLIIGTIVIYNQLKFIENKDLGYDREQVLIVEKIWQLGNKDQAFRDEIKHLGGVVNASLSGYLPTSDMGNSTSMSSQPVIDQKNAVLMQEWFADENYIPTLGIKMVAGRNYSKDMPTDSTGIVINEAAVRQFGFKDPLNKAIYIPQDNMAKVLKKYHVIGVMKDFNYRSLKEDIKPMAIQMSDDRGAMAVRIKTANVSALIDQIKTKWSEFLPNQQFEYSFMNDKFDALYRAEQRMGKISLSFTTLAIIIACLGLFGLAAYSAEQRTKEIGIRKVLGANVGTIVQMLSRDFLVLVAISILIASPLAWWAMSKYWLQSFAYRQNIQWWVPAMAAGGAILIAFATISFQSIKAALANPVKSLRSE